MTKSRKQKQNAIPRGLKAPGASQPPRVLIVTEGTVTEVQYFRLLAADMGFGQKQVVIDSNPASSPMQVVNLALKRLRLKERFDHIYCVFDRDTHANYNEAVNLVERMAKDNSSRRKVTAIKAITSIPCFEYWLYLHVGESAASHSGTGSPCSRLTRELKKHALFKNYSKKKEWMSANFKKLAANRDDAVKYSKRRLANARRAGEKAHSEDPSTRIHIVVDDLKTLSEMDEC